MPPFGLAELANFTPFVTGAVIGDRGSRTWVYVSAKQPKQPGKDTPARQNAEEAERQARAHNDENRDAPDDAGCRGGRHEKRCRKKAQERAKDEIAAITE